MSANKVDTNKKANAKKDIRNNVYETERLNHDKQGRVIPEAFPISKRTEKDQRKTSVAYTTFSILLYLLAILPVIAVTVVLAYKTYQLMPYYGFWPFVGTILAGVLMLVFVIVTLIVTRKGTKSSIFSQTAKVVFTFVFLTSFVGVLMTYVFPDIIAMATQQTMLVEDLYENAEEQAEINAKLDRDFIMYNILNGNLNEVDEDGKIAKNGDFSYATLSKRNETSTGVFLNYVNSEIQDNFDMYMEGYSSVSDLETGLLYDMEEETPHKFELYNFIYDTYVLADFDYALQNKVDRHCFALAILDYIYEHLDFEGLITEGFGNSRVKALFDKQFDSFQQDGYNTFDDSLLLYAQMEGRMTVPVVLRLILNESWSYSAPTFDEEGNPQYSEDVNFLFQVYDPDFVAKYVAAGGTFDYHGGTLAGVEQEIDYGFNEDGWMVFENGYYKRPMCWMVLDMQGTPMDLTSVDLSSNGPLGSVRSIVMNILNAAGQLTDSVGNLLNEDLSEVIQYAANGADLRLSLYVDDQDALRIKITPLNVKYGLPGYQYASWVQSNNLLTAVINVMNLRDYLLIFGGVGAVLLIAVGVLRECGKKTRERTEVSRDRIRRANSSPEGHLAEPEKSKKDKKKDKVKQKSAQTYDID